MSTDTPRTDAVIVVLPAKTEKYITQNTHWVSADMCRELERENARLREEVEMLNVRHAAAMLHAQTHADEYNALREDEKGLLQDIQRLTEEAFKRDEELAEAKRVDDVTMTAFATLEEKFKEQVRRAEQAEARSLEYKTEHAALLGTSQWQETEIADLRDDVKRLMQKDVLATLRKPSEAMVRAAYADQPDAINAGFAQAFLAMLDQFERDQGSAT